MKITKEASTFYFTFAMLLLCRKYLNDLIASGAVAQRLKQDFRTLVNRITDLERMANASLDGKAANQWRKEWTERDYELFGNVFALLTDMDEEKRSMLEDFIIELANGKVTVEITELGR